LAKLFDFHFRELVDISVLDVGVCVLPSSRNAKMAKEQTDDEADSEYDE
jgi:hypothetical protein